jgi:hypothetical protein
MEVKHNLSKRIAMVGVIFTLLLTGGCASGVKKEAVPQAMLTPGVKYEIASFDVDLVQKLHAPGFLNLVQTKQVMEKQFEMDLAKEGLLANSSDSNVAKIAVYVDYRRIFVGEDTFIPMDSVGPPRFTYLINVEENGVTKHLIHSQEMVVNIIALAIHEFIDAPINIVDNVRYSLVIGNGVARGLKEATPEFAGYVTNSAIETEYKAEIQSIITSFNVEKKVPAYLYEKYIPNSVVESYVSRFKSDDVDDRIDAYEDITKVWINDKSVFDIIDQKLLTMYKNELQSDSYDEAEAGIEALSSSGLPAYKATLKEISVNAKTSGIRKLAEKNIDVLTDRYRQALYIHQPAPAGNEVTWQQRQLYNMINADDFFLQKRAVKRIYREYPTDEFLLDTLSESLDGSTQGGYRTYLSVDYHAWVCRVLGMSENVKYKSKLDYIATHATYEKVRDFAEDYADELD